MNVFRRVVPYLLALVALVAALGVLVPRLTPSLERANDTGADDRANDTTGQDSLEKDSPLPSIPTSEDLIAAALKAGDITYEESLLARAYALFDDPRLQAAFRSPIIDWEAGSALLLEVNDKESTLSKGLLADLEPFRVRPTDPISIFNRPRADVVKAQAAATPEWVDLPVPGANARVWLKGTHEDLKKYVTMAARVWRAFPNFFTYPMPDNGQPGSRRNPDGAIDFYMMHGNDIDPRTRLSDEGGVCTTKPDTCRLGPRQGWSGPWDPTIDQTSSGYVLVNIDQADNQVIDTIAHELTHASQRAYDNGELYSREQWFNEGTATWVAYKVMKWLGVVPTWEYDRLDARAWKRGEFPPFFRRLHVSLVDPGNQYNAWLFFYYASMELGNGVVKAVWKEAAETPGPDGIQAVKDVIPLAHHFPRFSVRNWNQDPVPRQYKDDDDTFRPGLRPDPVRLMPADLGTFELDEPVASLAAQYYYFAWDASVHKVTFQNLSADLPDAHVWAIKKIGANWEVPEDWSRTPPRVFCRDSPTENVTELVLIVSNSHMVNPLPPAHPKPRIVAEDIGCSDVEGWAKTTLRVREENVDLTFVSSRAALRFKPRTAQEVPGNVQYDLMPTSITWTVSGRRDKCTVAGQAIVNVPDLLDQPIDVTRPASGYLNTVPLDGGDFHTLWVSAFDPDAMMKVTCPGNPPSVHEDPFTPFWLLQIASQANTHEGDGVVFKGKQAFDPDRALDSLPEAARQALASLPGVKDAMKNQPGGRAVYTFEWELRPLAGGK